MAQWEHFREQMRRVGRLTGAKWAAWLTPSEGGWQIEVAWGLTTARRQAVEQLLETANWRAWLSGALVQGRWRRRNVPRSAHKALGEHLHVFPRKGEGLLLVAAGPLEASLREMWRVVALSASLAAGANTQRPICEKFTQRLADTDARVNRVANAVVATVREKVDSLYAYLAVLEGRTWRILAMEGEHAAQWQPRPLPAGHLPDLHLLWEGKVVVLSAEPWPEGPEIPGQWVGIPLQQGRRLIGFVAVALDAGVSLSPALEALFLSFARRVVWVLEQALAFEETTEHLRRKAVLNDVLLAMLSSEDVEEAAQSATRHLRRVLQADVAMVMLPTREGVLEPVGLYPPEPLPASVPIETSLCGQVLESGRAARVDDVRQVSRYFPMNEHIRSEICVPLKSKSGVIGVLNLESTRLAAFTEEDERLLTAVAGHLALMLEVLRLRQDASARAQRMELVHQVIKEIVGLLDAQQVVEVAARRIAAYFGYEIAVVVVADEQLERPLFYGAAGDDAGRYAALGVEAAEWPPDGVIAHVLKTGQSMLVPDTDAEPLYRFFPRFKAGSELCVPLVSHEETDRVIGFINIERASKFAFTEEDKMAMEAIAGALSAVLSSACRYRRLESTIQHLEATRQTALDIIADLEMDTLLQRIVGRVKHLLAVQGVEIGLVDVQKGEVRIAAADTPQGECSGFVMPLGWGIGGRAAVSGQTIVVDDYATWEEREPDNTLSTFHAAASVPLKFADEVLGVLTVYDNDPRRKFSRDEIRLLELLAPQIAVALRNARLYRELADRMERQKHAEEELLKAGRLAAMGETAVSIAHKLNGPLTTVLGFAELLLEDFSPDAPAYEDLRMILREAQRARDAVQEMLDFARYPESYQIAANANTLLHETLSLVTEYMASKGVMLHLSLQEDLPAVVVDPGEVKYVFLNLIHTLLQTMPHGGKLYVTTAVEEDDTGRWVVVRVADTGREITPEQQAKLFEPFYVAPRGRQSRRTTMSYGIVKEDQSTFAVDEAGREPLGNVFAVYLPAM